MSGFMCLSTYLLAFGVLLRASSTQGKFEWSCPPWKDVRVSRGSYRHGEHCFVLTNRDHQLTWKDSETYCSNYGGILAMDKTQARHSFYDNEGLNNLNGSYICVWIGLTDKGHFRQWIWSDGEAVTDEGRWEFQDGVLGWLSDLAVDCTALCINGYLPNGTQHWGWFKKSCVMKYPIICQYDAQKIQTGDQRNEAPVDMTQNHRIVTRVFELPNWRGYRLKEKPAWTTKTYMVTNCARKCQNHEKSCSYFSFHRKTGECLAYISNKLLLEKNSFQDKQDDGLTLWQISTIKQF